MADRERAARRRFLGRAGAALAALGVAGCDRLSQTEWFPRLLGAAESINNTVAKAITGRNAMAQEFTLADLSPSFRSNGCVQW